MKAEMGYQPAILLFTFVVAYTFAILPPNYIQLSAQEKQNILWSQISANPYSADKMPTRFPQYDWVNASNILDANYNLLAFERYTDELPSGRVKLAGMFGASANFRYVPFGDTTGSGGYTGIYNSSTLGIVRCSLANTKTFAPTQAFKFLVDGQPSKTLMTYRGLSDRARNYFGDEYFTDMWGTVAIVANTIAFNNTINILPGGPNDRPEAVNQIPPYELAEIKPDGQSVGERVVAPFHIQMRVPDQLRNAIDPNSKADWRTNVIRAAPAGTLLFTMWGQAGPAAAFEPIGEIHTTSNFVVSRYQDEVLYFRHPHRRWVPPYHHSRNHGYNFKVNMGINV